jgi:hypothetical protein
MQQRVIQRAAAAAVTVLLLATVAVYADTIPADGDAVTPGNQSIIDLGQASPGQVVTWPVDFTLVCGGLSHAAIGSTITLAFGSATKPGDGSVAVTSTTIGPVPATWPGASQGCPSPTPKLASNSPSTVSLTMPSTGGTNLTFTIAWSRTGGGLTSSTAMSFIVDVVDNTPPVLHLPGDQLVEATSSAGAAVSWTATASDLEDAVPPTPTCAPASGSTFPLGMTTVNCSVTDGGGLTASGSFLVSVEDTSVPTLVGMPADQAMTTGDPSGATLVYTPPTATDLADPSPSVGCDPASGSPIPVGTTTVTCTATDATGNHASASFTVDVTYVAPVAWTAIWREPIASPGDTFVANWGRVVPVKVQVFANGDEQTSGEAILSIAGCGGGSSFDLPLAWDGSRWSGRLDTSALAGPGCYVATVRLDGHAAGTIQMDVRGAAVAAGASPKGNAKANAKH